MQLKSLKNKKKNQPKFSQLEQVVKTKAEIKWKRQNENNTLTDLRTVSWEHK